MPNGKQLKQISKEPIKLEDCHSYKIFNRAIKNDVTRHNYDYSLKEFLKYSNLKTYDNIVKAKNIQTLLENWIMDLSEKGLKGNTIRTKITPVELFLEMNKVIFYKKILHKIIPNDNGIAGGSEPFTNSDIKLMLAYTKKLRTKALIHFIASTGIRPGAIIDPILRRKDLIDMPNDCMAIKIYDNSKEGYYAFLTPEAKASLNTYFEARKTNGDKITADSPLFANDYDKIDGKGNRIKFTPMTLENLSTIMEDLVKHSGIPRTKTGRRYNKAVVYGFRKRFNTILKNNNQVNSNIAEKLMAHKNGLDGVYFVPTIQDCFTEFYKAVKDLTIDTTERQKAELKQKDLKINELEEKNQRISSLEKRMETMFRLMQSSKPTVISTGKDGGYPIVIEWEPRKDPKEENKE